MIPTVSQTAYEAARRGVGLLDRSARGRIVVAGPDRASYLQGLLTNDIGALRPGQGCYSAYLTPQGRMLADMLVYEVGDLILLTTAGEVAGLVMSRLDQFIFSEDVKLGDVTGTFGEHAVIGPRSAAVLSDVLDGVAAGVLDGLGEHGCIRASFDGHPTIVARITDTGEPGFDVFCDRGDSERLLARLSRAGGVTIDPGTAEALRIESGIPLFHRDMDEETIPLEAGIEERAISFTKGCYVGQEVIIRVLHRGHGRVARKLVGLLIGGGRPQAPGEPPAPGTPVLSGDRDVGRVTSATLSPALGHPIALAYLHRDFIEPGTALVVGGQAAVVSPLPFVPPPGVR
jgi:folate-binding protein YgfZ